MPRRRVAEIRNADSALSLRARLMSKAAELSGVGVGSSWWSDRVGWVGWRVLVVVVVVGGLLFGPVVGVSAATDEITAGQARAEQWWLESLRVSAAHEITRGAGARVCVIDGGPVVSHPDLQGVDFQDGQDLTGRGSPDGLAPVDDDDHGVSMIGLIAAQGHGEGVGLLGTAPEATIISVTIGARANHEVVAEALKACADAGADVVSLSYGTVPSLDAVAYVQARDVVLVGGAGNDGSRDGVANSRFGEVSVGGVNAQLQLDPHSNASHPSLSIPGKFSPQFDRGGLAITGPYSIESKGPDRSRGVGLVTLTQGGGYRRSAGTSSATAITAGVVALVRARYPELNAANVVNRLLVTAQSPHDEAFDPAGVPSPLYGWGVVDAYAALTEDVPEVEHNPLGSTYTGGTGVWHDILGLPDDGGRPERPEPPANVELAPAPVDAPIVMPEPSQPSPASPSGASDSEALGVVESVAGITPVVVAVFGGVLLVLVVVVVVRSRRRSDSGSG